MNYTAASAAAAARDDNVFYDSGREGRKIAHRSTFKTRTFSYATFPRPKCRAIKRDVLLFFIIFSFLIEQHFTSAEVTRRRRRRRGGGETATVYQKSEAQAGVLQPLVLSRRAVNASPPDERGSRGKQVKQSRGETQPAACTMAE